jgi:hypothetical protein
MFGFTYLLANYWLEVSLHPEGPATGQFDQKFSVVFLGHRANAGLASKLQVALHPSHAALPVVSSKFRSNLALRFALMRSMYNVDYSSLVFFFFALLKL